MYRQLSHAVGAPAVVFIVGLAYELLLSVVTNNEACDQLLLFLQHANDYLTVYAYRTVGPHASWY